EGGADVIAIAMKGEALAHADAVVGGPAEDHTPFFTVRESQTVAVSVVGRGLVSEGSSALWAAQLQADRQLACFAWNDRLLRQAVGIDGGIVGLQPQAREARAVGGQGPHIERRLDADRAAGCDGLEGLIARRFRRFLGGGGRFG